MKMVLLIVICVIFASCKSAEQRRMDEISKKMHTTISQIKDNDEIDSLGKGTPNYHDRSQASSLLMTEYLALSKERDSLSNIVNHK